MLVNNNDSNLIMESEISGVVIRELWNGWGFATYLNRQITEEIVGVYDIRTCSMKMEIKTVTNVVAVIVADSQSKTVRLIGTLLTVNAPTYLQTLTLQDSLWFTVSRMLEFIVMSQLTDGWKGPKQCVLKLDNLDTEDCCG